MTDGYVADFSNHARLSRLVGGKDVILRGVSALEYMGLFVGYVKAGAVEIYAKDDLVDEEFEKLTKRYKLVYYGFKISESLYLPIYYVINIL